MKYIILIFIVAIVSCSKDQSANISQEKMVEIVYDLTLASSAQNTSNKRDSIQYFTSYNQILKKHGTDSIQFVAAQNIYKKNPDVYAAIYDSVEVKLRKELEVIRASEPDEEEYLVSPIIDFKVQSSRNK